jgi:hypothetical protein
MLPIRLEIRRGVVVVVMPTFSPTGG